MEKKIQRDERAPSSLCKFISNESEKEEVRGEGYIEKNPLKFSSDCARDNNADENVGHVFLSPLISDIVPNVIFNIFS